MLLLCLIWFGNLFPKIYIISIRKKKIEPSNSKCTFKKPWGYNIIRQILEGIWLHTQREDGVNTSRHGLPPKPVAAIMMLYKNTKVNIRSPDGDTDYFDIVTGVLQGGKFAPYLYVICLDDVLRTFTVLMKENGFWSW